MLCYFRSIDSTTPIRKGRKLLAQGSEHIVIQMFQFAGLHEAIGAEPLKEQLTSKTKFAATKELFNRVIPPEFYQAVLKKVEVLEKGK